MPNDKTRILYDAVSKDYSIGTYEEFVQKMDNPEKRKAFYNGVGKEYSLGTFEEFESKVVKKKESTVSPSKVGTSVLPKTKADAIAESKSLGTPTGEYTYAPEAFDKEVPLAPQSRANKPIAPQPTVKPKEEFVYYEPDIYSEEVLAPKSRANKPKIEVESKPTISNDEFNKRISTITPDLVRKEEEFTVPQLNYQFKDFGFTFEETGLGDAVSVTAPNGKKTTISLGKTADRDLQKFLKENANQYDKLSKSISNQENYNKTFTDQKEIESSFVKIQQDQNDFTQSVQELYKIPKDTEEYKVKLAELQKKQTQIESSKKALNKSVGKYVAMKSTQGETSEYLYNQLLEGLTGAASGTAGLMIDAFAPSNMTDAEKKAAKKWIQPILRESLDFAKSESVTKEYAANVGFIEGAVGGLVKSLPAMLAAEAMPLVMAAQISDDLDVQMDSDPNFKNISENEKLFLKVPMMVGGAVLETYGFRNAIGTKGLLNDLVAKAIGKSTKSTTTKTFKEFIEQDIENRIAKGAIKIGAGGLAEFETGASQELLDITTKDIYNAAKGKDMFQTPNTFGEGAKQVIKAGLQEAIGGFILSTPSAFQKAKANNDYTELTDGQVEVLKNLGNDVNVMTAIEADLQNKVNLGDLTPKEAEEQLNDTRETVGVMNSIDTEELSNDQIKEALPIVDEIKKLEQQKEGKIPIQKKIIQAKIDELNAKLLKATGNEDILEPTKKGEDATKISSPTKMDVGKQPENGEGMGEGNAKEQTTPETSSGGVGGDVEIKNEGKADAPTKESVTERLNINNPFYKKVEDALVKLGLIEKYNAETGTGDVVGGYAQQTSDGGFSVGKMLFSQDGSISYFDGDVKVSFDKNGNVISENTKEAKQKANVLAIESKKESIDSLEKTRDSEAFKYKEVTETDILGNKKKVKRLKTEQELKDSTDKINAAIDKAKAELSNLEQSLKETPKAAPPQVQEPKSAVVETAAEEIKPIETLEERIADRVYKKEGSSSIWKIKNNNFTYKSKKEAASVVEKEYKRDLFALEQANKKIKPIEGNIYLPKEDKTHNISIAKKMLTDLGVNAEFSGYSDTNGVSVYFTNENGEKIRISDHSVTNKDRIQNEILLNFDTKTLGVGGKTGLKSNFESNKIKVQSIKQQPQPQKSIIAETKTTANTDNLIRKVQSYNALSKYQKGTKNGLLIQREISESAGKLGLDINITNPKLGTLKLSKEGKQVKHTAMTEDVAEPTTEAVTFAKQMIKQGAVDQWLDIGLQPAEIKKGVDGIRSGKMTKPAKILINALNERQADNGFVYTEKGIDGKKQSVFVSFDDILDNYLSNQQMAEALSQAEQDALAEEFDERFASLSEEQQQHIDNLFKEENEIEINKGTESKSDVSDKDVSTITAKEKAKQRVEKAKENFKKASKDKLSLGGLETLPEFTELVLAYIELGYVTAKDIISKIGEDLEGFDFDEKIATEKINSILAEQEVEVKEEKEPKKVKKTVSTIRAYEGDIREGVKRELEKLGLTREIESQSVAKAKAKAFVESVGEEAALEAVRNNDVRDAAGAYVWNELIESVGKKLILETNPDEITRLEKLQAQLLDELGREALSRGRFNAALDDIYQNSETVSYNVENRIKEYKDANNGEISTEVEAKFRELDRQLQDVKKRLAEAEARAKKAEDEATIKIIQEAAERESKQKTSTKIRKDTDWIVLKVKEAKIHRPNMFSSATPASLVWDGAVETVAAAIKITGRSAEAIAKGVEYVRNSDWYNNLNREDKKTALKQFNDFWKGSQPRVEEGKIKIPDSLIQDLVAQGANTIEQLVAEVKEIMIENYPNITDREIRDAITQYGKIKNLNKDEIAAEIRKIKRIGRIISALEDVNAKKRPLRSGIQRDKLDADERALNKELREAMKELPIDEALEEEEQKNATDAAKTRILNQIEDLQREIDKGELVPRKVRTIKDDAELTNLKAKRDALKAEHEAIFKDEEFRQAKRLELTKRNTQKRIEDLQRRIKEGDFSKKARTPLIKDSELLKLRAEKLRIQDEYDKELYKVQLKNRKKFQKTVDSLWELWGIPRILMATGEASFILIQGAKIGIAHPLHAAKAFKESWKSFKSEKYTEQFLRDIKAQDYYPVMKDSKLALTEPKAELLAREELFYSGWTNMIWDNLGKIILSPTRFKDKATFDRAAEAWSNLNPFKAVERASIGYLDTIRVLRFLDGMNILETQGKTFESNPQDYKDVANAINTLTGRASLGKAEQFAATLSKVFFSPRNWASGIKTATPYALYHFGKMTPTARKMAISDLSKYVGLTTTMVMLAAAYLNDDDDEETSVELDPRSSDFMKIKLGNTRVDPWGGMQQQVVLSSRMIAWALMFPNLTEGAFKKNGKVLPLGLERQTPTALKLLGQQAVNKLNPTASVVYNYLSSKRKEDGTLVDEYYNEITLKGELQDKFNPIFWNTVDELLKEDPTALDGLLTFYAFLGGGVNVYENKPFKDPNKILHESNPKLWEERYGESSSWYKRQVIIEQRKKEREKRLKER
jgi:hypothetical protein